MARFVVESLLYTLKINRIKFILYFKDFYLHISNDPHMDTIKMDFEIFFLVDIHEGCKLCLLRDITTSIYKIS